MSNRANRVILACLAAFAAESAIRAGEVEPPAGAVAPTMKSLDVVEPRSPIGLDTTPGDADSLFKITQSGSYYLVGDVVGVAFKHGIEISASNVSIDLMGFSVGGAANSMSGIRIDTGGDNLTVRNGSVSGWGDSGIDLKASAASRGSLIEFVHSSLNGAIGIRSNEHGIIRNCTATSNGSIGIIGFGSSMVQSCASHSNGSDGIAVGDNASVLDSVASSNGGDGIMAGSSVVVANCTADNNADDGIAVSVGRTVRHCVANRNNEDGIEVQSDCLVIHNSCDLNGFDGNGAGIHVLFVRNRIEGNHVAQADRGIDVDSAQNLVFGNSAVGNTINFDVAAGNLVGAMVTNQAAMDAASNDMVNFSF